MKMEAQIRLINLDQIIPNRFQPRLQFDQEALDELADSIREHGIIQPLVLRRVSDKYEIIAGERRYKAAQKIGLTAVPAIIAELDDNESAEVAIIENTQRRNLSAIEEAKSYKKLLDRKYLTQEQLAKRLGISQSAVANKLRLLNLDEMVQDALINEKISERHARSLLKISDRNIQLQLLNKVIAERWPVKRLDEVIEQIISGNPDAMNTNSMIDINDLDVNVGNIVNNATDLFFDGKEKTQDFNAPASTAPKKDSLFFNNLENEAANMNPTFGFNPFQNDQVKPQDLDYETLDTLDDEPIIIKKQEENNVKEQIVAEKYENMDDVIKGIKKIINTAKENGVLVENEEFNFDTLYQFIIRINK